MPGTAFGASHKFTYLITTMLCGGYHLYLPLTCKEIEAQRQTTSRGWSQGLQPGGLGLGYALSLDH